MSTETNILPEKTFNCFLTMKICDLIKAVKIEGHSFHIENCTIMANGTQTTFTDRTNGEIYELRLRNIND